MTKKQEQIRQAAIQLFSQNGFHATSTSQVARQANVSEGLIFRHFKNKDGLLKDVLQEGMRSVGSLLNPIIKEEDPKQILRNSLELPFKIKETKYELWKLLFKLKWELEDKNIDPLITLNGPLTRAFIDLRYKAPQLESEFLLQLLNGLTSSIIMHSIEDKEKTKNFLYRKYYLE